MNPLHRPATATKNWAGRAGSKSHASRISVQEGAAAAVVQVARLGGAHVLGPWCIKEEASNDMQSSQSGDQNVFFPSLVEGSFPSHHKQRRRAHGQRLCTGEWMGKG